MLNSQNMADKMNKWHKARSSKCSTICEILEQRTEKTIASNATVSRKSDFVQSNAMISQILVSTRSHCLIPCLNLHPPCPYRHTLICIRLCDMLIRQSCVQAMVTEHRGTMAILDELLGPDGCGFAVKPCSSLCGKVMNYTTPFYPRFTLHGVTNPTLT